MRDKPVLAVLAVLLRASQALLVQRRNAPDAGLWGFPGGRVEFGETVQQAALRELAEETGLQAQTGPVLGQRDLILPAHHFHLVAVLCDTPHGVLQAGDDAAQARWVDIGDILAQRLPMSEGVADLCRTARARIAQNPPSGN